MYFRTLKCTAGIDKIHDISQSTFRSSALYAALHGGCSSMVEHQIVVLDVAGSSPVTHPFIMYMDVYDKLLKYMRP